MLVVPRIRRSAKVRMRLRGYIPLSRPMAHRFGSNMQVQTITQKISYNHAGGVFLVKHTGRLLPGTGYQTLYGICVQLLASCGNFAETKDLGIFSLLTGRLKCLLHLKNQFYIIGM